MIAITLPDAATARAISAALWRLSRPDGVTGGAEDVTRFVAPVIGAVLLADPDWALPIHPQVVARLADPADPHGTRARLAALLGPLLARPADLATAQARLLAGGTLRLGELLPLLRAELIGAPPAAAVDP